MLRVMIKNHLKLILRNKWLLGIMVIGPLIVIAAISSAFQGILATKTEVKPFHVGYSIQENSPYESLVTPIALAGKENQYDMSLFEEGKEIEMLETGKVQVFIKFGTTDYTIYASEENEKEASIIKYILFSITHAVGDSIDIPSEKIEFLKLPSAVDYYGKAEIIYFLWCGMVVLSTVILSERKNRIQSRLRLSPANNIQIYLGKVIPCFLAIVVEITIGALLSTFIFEIHWGCYLKTIGLLLIQALAVSTFGVALFYLVSNIATAIVLAFVIVWIMGFFGGSFETYMFSSIPDSMKQISPIYHMNRALVEFETIGHSTYTDSAVIIHLAIIVICSIIGCALMKRRMEEK